MRAGPGADVVLGGVGADSTYGESGADRLVDGGPSYGDLMDGGIGNDHLVGKARAVIFGGRGDDVMECQLRDDLGLECPTVSYAPVTSGGVVIDLVDDAATGEGNDEFIDIDSVEGTDQDDLMYGDADRNTLDARVEGGAGRDRITADGVGAGDGVDVLLGGDGGDLLLPHNSEAYGEAGSDGIYASSDEPSYPNLLSGGPGRDTLSSRSGGNTLGGGEEDDILDAFGADEVLSGGEGTDRLRFERYDSSVHVDLELGTATGQGQRSDHERRVRADDGG